jgi:ACS family glucarate transporter-like MFS transporter
MIPKRYWLIFGTFLLSMLLYVDRACIATAKDAIHDDLGFSETQWGWIMAAFGLGYALCQTPAGLAADRFGPRRLLTGVVAFWSLFTALTGAAWNFLSMLVFRVLFGAGEAGAFPGCARAYFSWLPTSERGLAQGINFSGSRLGAAAAMPLVAWMIDTCGWRPTFIILGFIGFFWAVFWFLWFRDEPEDHPKISEAERELILAQRQTAASGDGAASRLTAATLFGSRNMWLAMGQYICSNFTFYFAISWSFPYVKKTFGLDSVEAGFYTAIPLIGGALGNWLAGSVVDAIYRSGRWRLSRQLPAIVGFLLAAAGLVGTQYVESAIGYSVFMAIAILGADMTLSPSWAFCIDIGRKNAGAVSGTMNMAGNLAAVATMLAFPYLYEWTGSTTPYFLTAAVLNVMAVGLWMLTRPETPLEEW